MNPAHSTVEALLADDECVAAGVTVVTKSGVFFWSRAKADSDRLLAGIELCKISLATQITGKS